MLESPQPQQKQTFSPRRRALVGLWVSLLLHGALAVLIWRGPNVRRPGVPARSAPIELQIVHLPVESPRTDEKPASLGTGAVPAPSRRPSSRPSQRATKAAPEPSAVPRDSPAEVAAESDAPRTSPTLLPREGALGFSTGPTPGHKAVDAEREDDAETALRVGARVEELVRGDISRRKVENGAADSYFADLRRAWEPTLQDGPLFGKTGTPNAAQKVFRNWLAQAQTYGSKAGALTSDVRDAIRREAAGDSDSSRLVLILELHQSRAGAILGTLVLRTSGNRQFDRWVIERANALTLPPLPDSAWGEAHALRISTWEVEGRVSYLRMMKATAALKRPTDAALLVGSAVLGANFDEVSGEVQVLDPEHPHFVTLVRLLAVN